MKRPAVYSRVSTATQTTDSQDSAVLSFCEGKGWGNPLVFRDVASGGAASRPALDRMMRLVREGVVSHVVVHRLDRLGRSLSHLAMILEELQGRGVPLVAIAQGIDTSVDSAVGRLQASMLSAVAEYERALIRERVISGLEYARSQGRVGGRPKGVVRRMQRAVDYVAREVSLGRGLPSLTDIMDDFAISSRLGMESAQDGQGRVFLSRTSAVGGRFRCHHPGFRKSHKKSICCFVRFIFSLLHGAD